MNEKINDWFNNLSEPQRLELTELRKLILGMDKRFREEINWGQPCYSINKLVCYLQKSREHVRIGFQQSAHLKDANKILVGESKHMRHVKFSLSEEIDQPAIAKLIAEAIDFDCR